MHEKNHTKQVLSVTETNTRGKFKKKKEKKNTGEPHVLS